MVIDVLSCNGKHVVRMIPAILLHYTPLAEYSPAVEATLKLGVSLLKGGNEKVQKVCGILHRDCMLA